MSGGGRCNFTNLNITFDNYLSHNRHFLKSALSRYTQWDFIRLVESYGIGYYEKCLGQLFCEGKSSQIVDMLLQECDKGRVSIKLNQEIKKIRKNQQHFEVSISSTFISPCLIVASGGLSIPTMGSSPYGYELAKQFGIQVYPTSAGLVPFTLHVNDKEKYEPLSGTSIPCVISCNGMIFKEQLLFTHRGLSGPAVLQISSYWKPGDRLIITMAPDLNIKMSFDKGKQESPHQRCQTLLSKFFSKNILQRFINIELLEKSLYKITHTDIKEITTILQHWEIIPNSTEGYRTAEVTLGGIDCNELSSKTFESRKVSGLYFIGEVVDVSGWLGGYNFQWAWSSGQACARAIINS